MKNGSERVVTSAREHIYDLRGLENYSFVDEFGKDQGINIRYVTYFCTDYFINNIRTKFIFRIGVDIKYESSSILYKMMINCEKKEKKQKKIKTNILGCPVKPWATKEERVLYFASNVDITVIMSIYVILLGEKWDEVPRWKKDSNNEFSDKKTSTLGFEESPNNRYLYCVKCLVAIRDNCHLMSANLSLIN